MRLTEDERQMLVGTDYLLVHLDLSPDNTARRVALAHAITLLPGVEALYAVVPLDPLEQGVSRW